MGRKNKQNGGDEENKLVVSISSKLNKVSKLSSNCCIYKVPRVLHKIKEEAYIPQIISIGPFHRGKTRLKPMEEHKWRYLNDFLNKDPKYDIDYYVQNLRTLEKKVRGCYGETVNLKSDDFVEMMLLDGCFIIELILKSCMADLRHRDDPIFGTVWMLNSIKLDMALFENQLPFFVLEHLFNILNGPDERFCVSSTPLSGPDQRYCVSTFLQLTMKFSKYDVLGQDVVFDRNSGEVKHLVHLIRKCHLPSDKRMLPKGKRGLEFIPTATELHNAGVKFKKGGGKSFLDVRFKKGIFKGVFEIPPIKIDSASDIIIRNIIAFEHFDQHPNYITQYIMLMDSLINTADDVALLRDCGIINNWLCDNKELAILFNELCDGAIIDTETFYYARLFEDVNSYYEGHWHKWQAKLKRYFHTPWSTLSFIAAVILLVCTIIQTVFAVLS